MTALITCPVCGANTRRIYPDAQGVFHCSKKCLEWDKKAVTMSQTVKVYAVKLALILLCASTLAAQVVPTAHKPAIDRAQWALLAAQAGAHVYDTYATRRMIQNGGRELFLPPFIVQHDATMAAFSAGMVGVQYLIARQLTKRGHSRLAKSLTIFDIGATTTAASLAMQVHREPASFELPPGIIKRIQ